MGQQKYSSSGDFRGVFPPFQVLGAAYDFALMASQTHTLDLLLLPCHHIALSTSIPLATLIRSFVIATHLDNPG